MKFVPHKKSGPGKDSSLTVEQGVLMAALFLFLAIGVEAAQPTWWTATGGPLNSNPSNDYQAVNQGQLKQFTQKAVFYLDTNLPGGAGPTLDNLVANWSTYYATNHYSATNPAPQDFQVVNVGQAKYIGSLIYSQLSANGYTGLYPAWLTTSTNNDYMVANLGQLKTVFNFDITSAPAAVTGLTGTSTSSTEIDLSWTLPATNNANSLTLQQSIDGGTTWTTVASLDATSTNYTLSGLDASQNYIFRFTNQNAGGISTSGTTTPNAPIPNSPSDLAGSLDTSGQMNLTWPTVPGATSYIIEREPLDGSNIWSYLNTSGTTNYSDYARASSMGYHYRISATDTSGSSTPGSSFPQSRYAVIDLGTNQTPIFFNNQGAAVLQSGTINTYWANDTGTVIPLASVNGLNNNGVVIGNTGTSSIYGNSLTGTYQVSYSPITTWTASGGTGSPFAAPSTDFVTNQSISVMSVTSPTYTGFISETPVGLSDGTGTVTAYGNAGEFWTDGISPWLDHQATAGVKVASQTLTGSIISWVDGNYPLAPSPLVTSGNLYTFKVQNGANVALARKISLAPGNAANYVGTYFTGPDYSTPGIPGTWVAYDGTDHVLDGVPAAIASNNDIVGTDTNSPPTSVYLWQSYTRSGPLVNGIAGPINNSDQIVSGNLLWQTNVLSSLNDLLPEDGSWRNVQASNANGAINDSGAIVGTATYTGTATTAGSHGVLLVAANIMKVISNQFTGLEFNELPTGLPYSDPVKKAAHLVSDYNNPMIMACNSGTTANLSLVIGGIPTSLASKFLVGVRQAGTTTILASTPVQLDPTRTLLTFPANNGAQKYQIVIGYDANGNGVLDPSEVSLFYAGTGGIDPPSGPTNQDKIYVTTQSDYTAAVTYLNGYTPGSLASVLYPNAAAMTKTFLDSTVPPLCSSVTPPTTFTLYSNDPDLKHPLGANWSASGSAGSATANFYTYDSTTSLCADVVNSNSIKSIILNQIAAQKTTVLNYFTTNPSATTYPSSSISYSSPNFSFSTLDPRSDAFYSLGSVDTLQGHFQFTATKSTTMLGTITINVTALAFDGTLSDPFDFYFLSSQALLHNGGMVQAGYPALGTSGRVFDSYVTFSVPTSSYTYKFQ